MPRRDGVLVAAKGRRRHCETGEEHAMKRPDKLLTRGLITGLYGAAAVALWFFFLDFSDGHPFRTPAALGSALLLGVSKAEAMQVTFGVVAAYTVVHVLAFAAVASST